MKTVLITGAAAGIGLATARLFTQRGYFVGLYDVNRAALDILKNSGEFPHACFGVCDVRELDSLRNMFENFDNLGGHRLDVLVNNAGVLSSGDFANIAAEAHDAMIDINIRALTHVAQIGFSYLRKTDNSCLINLCSVSSVHGLPGLAVYSASKFYVNGLTQALSLEWAKFGIRVSCVKPPLVRTAMADRVDDSLKSVFQVDTEPEDVAEAIARAVAGKSDGYFMGATAKLWSRLDRLLPDGLGRSVTRYLTKA